MPRAPKSAVLLASLPLSDADSSLINSLSQTEKLLVVQATYQLGSADFKAVSKLLYGHPLLTHRGKLFFNAEKCQKVFAVLMKEVGLEYSQDEPLPANAPKILQLAKKHYMGRVQELREAMQLEQDKFRIIFSEIEEIKEGKWDHKMDEPLVSMSTTAQPVVAKGGRRGGRKSRGSVPESDAETVADFEIVGEDVAPKPLLDVAPSGDVEVAEV